MYTTISTSPIFFPRERRNSRLRYICNMYIRSFFSFFLLSIFTLYLLDLVPIVTFIFTGRQMVLLPNNYCQESVLIIVKQRINVRTKVFAISLYDCLCEERFLSQIDMFSIHIIC